MAQWTPMLVCILSAWACFGCGLAAENETPVRYVKTDQPLIALTFDDGPSKQTEALLQILKDENAKATFFVMGCRVAKSADLVKAIVAQGHELGNHTYSHANLTKLDERGVRDEIRKSQEVLHDNVGISPKIFRAPGLQMNDTVWKVLREFNMPAIHTNCSVDDWDKITTTEDIVSKALSKPSNGSIVLLHDWPETTVMALPAILRELKAKGFRFVTVSELLEIGKTSKE